MGVSDPDVRKKIFGPRWQHEIEKQGWPLWKRLIHHLQRCPICRPKAKTHWKIDHQDVSTGSSETPATLVKSVIAEPLELCIDNDPRYRPCGNRDITDPNFFANADVNVSRNEQALAALNRIKVPIQLQSILQQFRGSLSFYSTMERRRLEYLRTGSLRVLSTRIGAIDPSTECVEEIRELNAARTRRRRYELSRDGWHNCMNSAWQRIEPAYPQEAWRMFLRDYGIAEQFTNKPID